MNNEQPDHSEGTTSSYRAYLIGRDGRVENAIPVMADNDNDAVAQVLQMNSVYEIELWDRSRVVIRLPALSTR